MRYKTKIYRSLESCPIWHFDKVQKDSDLRYLMILDNYDKLPDINGRILADLTKTYADLIQSYKSGKNRVLEAKKRVISLLIDMVIDVAQNSKDVNKLRKASTILRALMIDSSHEEFLWDVKFTETPGQRQLLTQLSLAIKKYNDQVKRSKDAPKQDIYEQAATIQSVLGVNIDIHKCSVKQYQAYIKLCNMKVTATNKHVN